MNVVEMLAPAIDYLIKSKIQGQEDDLNHLQSEINKIGPAPKHTK
jgi:hypothetical protein